MELHHSSYGTLEADAAVASVAAGSFIRTLSHLHSCSTVMKEDELLDAGWILHPNHIISWKSTVFSPSGASL